MTKYQRFLPCLGWLRRYDGVMFKGDLLAAVIVTIMLIPQSLAYALLAGLPPEVGLYASILPLVGYALFGSSAALAVGPVAVVSLMTAVAIGELASQGTQEYIAAAIILALLSGLMLIAMGLLRLGFLANFLSHPVVSGFITASGLIIAASQLKHILGVPATGHNLYEILLSLAANLHLTNPVTLAVGAGAVLFLFWVRSGMAALLVKWGVPSRVAATLARTGPVFGVAVTTLLTWSFSLDARGVAIVADVPAGLPPLTMPKLEPELWLSLAPSALLISVIGFVESVSVARTLAAKKRRQISPNRELVGLGAANIAAAFSGGYPVTGGFARSVVNFDAGAATPAAGVFTALGIALAALFLTPLLYFLPKATLAATIIVAVLSLVDFGALKRIWAYSKADFSAMAATILLTLLRGVETGIVAGVLISIAFHLYRTSRPHWAVVGRLPGSEHFRNILRHKVVTQPQILSIRVDESLYFPNARFLEDLIADQVAANPAVRHVILVCPAVNFIDASALESLEEINHRLKVGGVKLHLSEVKGPVMDRLRKAGFPENLTGDIFLSQHQAVDKLSAETAPPAATEKETNPQR